MVVLRLIVMMMVVVVVKMIKMVLHRARSNLKMAKT